MAIYGDLTAGVPQRAETAGTQIAMTTPPQRCLSNAGFPVPLPSGQGMKRRGQVRSRSAMEGHCAIKDSKDLHRAPKRCPGAKSGRLGVRHKLHGIYDFHPFTYNSSV